MKRILVLGVVAVVVGLAACGSATGGPAPGADGGGNAAGCPTSMPSGACAVDGLSCDYGCDTGGPGTAACSNGLWQTLRSNIACIAPPPVDAGPPPADAPFACGTQTCGTTQFCVQPCCGGAGPLCEPNDSGTCPAGFHPASCPSGPGCEMDPCTPPPPFCVDSKSDPRASGCGQYDKGRTLSCVCA